MTEENDIVTYIGDILTSWADPKSLRYEDETRLLHPLYRPPLSPPQACVLSHRQGWCRPFSPP